MRPDFDPQPTLTGKTLALRPLTAADRAGLFAAASDPLIWAGHPAKTRHEQAVFDPYFDALLASGATLVVIDRNSGDIAGCSRYYAEPGLPDSICIGYTFLIRALWGGAANREMKRLMFDHAFATTETILLHIGDDNIRSQRATAKLGAVHQSTGMIDLGAGPALMQTWAITRDAWQAGDRT